MKIFLACLLLNLSTLQEGEKLFLENKPQEALTLLEQALNENPDNEKIYLYLGIVYEQMNDPDKATRIMKRGLGIAKAYKDLLYYNMGNNFFRQEEYTLSEQMYSKAVEVNQQLEDAYLNRANSRLELENFKNAREDYIHYLQLAPASPQRQQIEKLIGLLGGILEKEKRKQQEEIKKQRDLLNEVLNSLKNASEDTRNLSAGSEKIEEEYEEIDISD